MRIKLASYTDKIPEMYRLITTSLRDGKKIELSFRDLKEVDAVLVSAPFKALYLQYKSGEIARYIGMPKMDLSEKEQNAKEKWVSEITKTKELAHDTQALVELCNEINALPHDFVGDLHAQMVMKDDVDAMKLLSDNTGVRITYTYIDLREFTKQGFYYQDKTSTPVGKPYPVKRENCHH